MTVEEAAKKLLEYYLITTNGQKAIQAILFGIEYADHIHHLTSPEIVRQANMPLSYNTEVSYGRQLAKYVRLNA